MLSVLKISKQTNAPINPAPPLPEVPVAGLTLRVVLFKVEDQLANHKQRLVLYLRSEPGRRLVLIPPDPCPEEVVS